MRRDRRALVLAAVVWFAPPGSAQDQPAEPPAPPATEDDRPRVVDLNTLPPPVRLGARVELVRARLPVLPVAVVVPDERSYVGAVSRWSLAARFPVLIDDGTAQAREDIARFVRAFGPQRVVRWSAPGDDPPWPDRHEERRERILAAVARAWGAEPGGDAAAAIGARWKEVGLTPPGIVAASTRDPAWTAALALAAGRGQPLAWVQPLRQVNATYSIDECAALARAVEEAGAATGLAWRALGDDLDAVTLCLDVPARVRLKETGRDALATTDLVGRHGQGEGAGPRWAWCGQVFGSSPRAAYAAMCALFLRPAPAWLFDGYPAEGAWAEFDCTAAAEEFRAAGFDAAVRDAPAQGERDWRAVAASPLRAGLVMVNSRGRADLFHLEPGAAAPGDVPILQFPAAVHFVHSFSAVQPGQRRTIAGRWVERGAYAYFGSVDEPFLQSYVPTPAVARRLLAGAPWGAAVRPDDGAPWKNTVVGDPLLALGGPAPRSGADLPLEGAADLEDELRAATEARDFAAACRVLTLLGRDEQAARLALAVLRDDAASFTGALAEASLFPLFRAGRRDEIPGVYARLEAPAGADPAFRDLLWNALWPLLDASSEAAIANLLRDNLREDQVARDAIDLAPLLERAHGPGAGRALLSTLAGEVQDERERAELQRALTRRPRR